MLLLGMLFVKQVLPNRANVPEVNRLSTVSMQRVWEYAAKWAHFYCRVLLALPLHALLGRRCIPKPCAVSWHECMYAAKS